jgi:ankyrin repeat protein
VLAQGADINAKNNTGQTPLHQALKSKNYQVALYLLKEKKIGLTEVDKDGDSVADYAFMYGDEAIVQEVLEQGTDINAKNAKGNTPLHVAIKCHNKKVAPYLLQNKLINLEVLDSYGNAALHSAIVYEKEEIASKVLKKMHNVNIANNQGNTPLHLACNNRLAKIVRGLLEKGANVNHRNADNKTPLQTAMEVDQAIVSVLLKQENIEVNDLDNKGFALLHYASDRGNKEQVADLLKNKADVNLKSRDGCVPVQLAIMKEHSEIALMILEDKNIDVDVQDSEGNTALHCVAASRSPDEKVLRRLLEKGASLNIVDNDGHSPFYYAGDKEIIKWFFTMPRKTEIGIYMVKSLFSSLYLGLSTLALFTPEKNKSLEARAKTKDQVSEVTALNGQNPEISTPDGKGNIKKDNERSK